MAPTKVVTTLLNAPLPAMIERLGVAIANAQAALDRTALTTAREMATTKVDMGGVQRNLLALGFTPSFYHFTEATIDLRVAFTVTQEIAFSVGGKATFGKENVWSATIDASYSRKYSFEASGSSAIITKLVAIPPPPEFLEQIRLFALKDPASTDFVVTTETPV